MMVHCPRCGEEGVIKSGHVAEGQRWKCKLCNYQFTRQTPRGKPLWQKYLAVFLYTNGMSMNGLAKLFSVQPSTILKWVRAMANTHALGEGLPEVTVQPLEKTAFFPTELSQEKPRWYIVIEDESFMQNIAITIKNQHSLQDGS